MFPLCQILPATCELCGNWLPDHQASCPRNGVHPSQWTLGTCQFGYSLKFAPGQHEEEYDDDDDDDDVCNKSKKFVLLTTTTDKSS